jgi:glutathione synthase/RimK-type ligase-like ATP-grasp enzyme
MPKEQKILLLEAGMQNSSVPFGLPHQNIVKAFNGDILIVYDGNALRISVDKEDILDFDAVVTFNWIGDRCVASVIARHLKRYGVPFLFRDMVWLRSKLTDLEMFAAAGIRYPRTFFASRSFFVKNVEAGMAELDLQFPVVVKHVFGYAGENNFRVNSKEKIIESIKMANGTVPKRMDSGYLVQEYIENELHDYRVVVVGGEAVLVVKRQRPDDSRHTNNISHGGKGTIIPLAESEAIWAPAVAAAKAVDRDDCTGVDLVVDQKTGLTYVLESNEYPALLDMHLEEKIPPIYRYIDKLIREKHASN